MSAGLAVLYALRSDMAEGAHNTSRGGELVFRRMLMQFSGVVAGRIVAAAAQAFAIVLLARWSNPTSFGLVIAVQTVLLTLSVVTNVGLPQYIGVLRAKAPESSLVARLYRLNRVTSWIATGLATIVLLVLGYLNATFWFFVPLGLSFGLGRNAAIWDSIAVADGQVGLFSSNLVLRRINSLWIFVVLHFMQIEAVLSYCVAVLLAQLLYNIRMHRRCVFDPGKHPSSNSVEFRAVFKDSKHFWVDSMSGMVRQLDVAAISVVVGPLAAGYLAVPSRIASPMMLLPSSFATLILPRVSSGGARAARHGLYLAVVVTVLIGGVLALLSPFLDELIDVLLGKEYLPAIAVTRIYFIAFVGLSLTYTLGAVLQGLKFHSAVGRNSAAFSVLSIVLLVTGGNLYGLEGAAWGYVIGTVGQVIGLLALLFFYLRGNGEHTARRPGSHSPRATGHPLPRPRGKFLGDQDSPGEASRDRSHPTASRE